MTERPRPPVVLVLSGPSGAGKSTLVDRYMERHEGDTTLVVSATTRAPRASEVEGVDYLFLGPEEFRERIGRDGFLEHAEVHGNYYGTPRDQVDEALAAGRDVLLEIDVQGGLQVKEKLPAAILCFLTPPTFEDLETRLRGRNEDSETVIAKRLANARREYLAIGRYEYVVVNDSLERAQEDLEAIVRAERCSLRYSPVAAALSNPAFLGGA